MHDLKCWDKPLEEMSDGEIRQGLRELAAENKIVFLPMNDREAVDHFQRVFKCRRGGRCCTGEMSQSGGGIALLEHEVERLAVYKGVTREEFEKSCVKRGTEGVRLRGDMASLSFPCPFYEGGCSIYDNRPLSCMFFPLGIDLIGGVLRVGIQVACPGGLLAAQEILLGIKRRVL